MVASSGFDSNAPREVGIPPGLTVHVVEGDRLVLFRTPKDKINGILLLPSGPVLVASRPIVHTNYGGPARGALVTASVLDGAEMSRLSKKAHISLSVFRYDDDQMPADVA